MTVFIEVLTEKKRPLGVLFVEGGDLVRNVYPSGISGSLCLLVEIQAVVCGKT